jgi:hypothetical protein
MRTTTWMMRGAILCALATGGALPTGAQEIFKCVESNATPHQSTAYQSTPCANGHIETQMRRGAPRPRAEHSATLSSLPAQQPSGTAWPGRRTLALGMSDDEVLNLPGWGRPNRITRLKAPREWREEWVYGQSTTGQRHLHFANATLVEIIDKPPLDHFVSLTLQ